MGASDLKFSPRGELVAPKRQLPDDPHPEADERFHRLLRAMVNAPEPEPDEKTQSEESQTSNAENDEGCADIQTPTDTSEDAS
jgi:hypothetical protein